MTEVDERVGQRFRETMATVCSPVTVVTTIADGSPHGTTVSAFVSLSLDPPMVLVALDLGSDLLALLRHGRPFGVNVLASDQPALATAFARKGSTKFAGVPWRLDGGAPRIDGSGGWLACVTTDVIPRGDHAIVLGEVRNAEPAAGAPLTYHVRRFGTHAELDV